MILAKFSVAGFQLSVSWRLTVRSWLLVVFWDINK